MDRETITGSNNSQIVSKMDRRPELGGVTVYQPKLIKSLTNLNPKEKTEKITLTQTRHSVPDLAQNEMISLIQLRTMKETCYESYYSKTLLKSVEQPEGESTCVVNELATGPVTIEQTGALSKKQSEAVAHHTSFQPAVLP